VFNPTVKKSEIQLKIGGNNKIQICNIDKKSFTEKKILAPEVNINYILYFYTIILF